MTKQAGRARIGVALLFFTNGALFANLLPRYPAIKSAIGLSNTEFGFAVASFSIGALLAGLSAGVLIRRFGSARVAVVGTMANGLGVLLAGLSPSWGLLSAALFLAGAMDAITDVAENYHGLRVQRLYQRSILNSFHALWSVGAVAGGLMGGAAAGLRVPLGIHLGVSLALFSVVSIVAYRMLLPGREQTDPHTEDQPPASTGARSAAVAKAAKWGVILALVLIAGSGAVVEDAGSTWAALYLTESLGSSIGIAALGFVAMQGMQFLGRIVGDRFVDRFGQRTVARVGGAVTAVGMGTAIAFPSIAGTIVGFGAAGLGIATLIPAAMQAADRLPGFPPGTGLAVVGWLLRVGFLLSPPVVGLVADATELRFALLLVPIAGVAVILLSSVLSTARRSEPSTSPKGEDFGASV